MLFNTKLLYIQNGMVSSLSLPQWWHAKNPSTNLETCGVFYALEGSTGFDELPLSVSLGLLSGKLGLVHNQSFRQFCIIEERTNGWCMLVWCCLESWFLCVRFWPIDSYTIQIYSCGIERCLGWSWPRVYAGNVHGITAESMFCPKRPYNQ